jgi:hypothetical protein
MSWQQWATQQCQPVIFAAKGERGSGEDRLSSILVTRSTSPSPAQGRNAEPEA